MYCTLFYSIHVPILIYSIARPTVGFLLWRSARRLLVLSFLLFARVNSCSTILYCTVLVLISFCADTSTLVFRVHFSAYCSAFGVQRSHMSITSQKMYNTCTVSLLRSPLCSEPVPEYIAHANRRYILDEEHLCTSKADACLSSSDPTNHVLVCPESEPELQHRVDLCAPRRRVPGILPELLTDMDQLFDGSLDDAISEHLVARDSALANANVNSSELSPDADARTGPRQRRTYIECSRCENPSVSAYTVSDSRLLSRSNALHSSTLYFTI